MLPTSHVRSEPHIGYHELEAIAKKKSSSNANIGSVYEEHLGSYGKNIFKSEIKAEEHANLFGTDLFELIGYKQEIKSKKKRFNKTRCSRFVYLMLFLREQIFCACAITAILIQDIGGCAEQLRDWSLRSGTNVWKYNVYSEISEDKKKYYTSKSLYIFDITNYNNAFFKDPAVNGNAFPIPTLETWSSLIQNIEVSPFNEIVGGYYLIMQSVNLFREIEDYCQQGLYMNLYNLTLGTTILPCTGKVEYFTKTISPEYYGVQFYESFNITNTNRVYRNKTKLRTDNFSIDDSTFKYSEKLGRYPFIDNPYDFLTKGLMNTDMFDTMIAVNRSFILPIKNTERIAFTYNAKTKVVAASVIETVFNENGVLDKVFYGLCSGSIFDISSTLLFQLKFVFYIILITDILFIGYLILKIFFKAFDNYAFYIMTFQKSCWECLKKYTIKCMKSCGIKNKYTLITDGDNLIQLGAEGQHFQTKDIVLNLVHKKGLGVQSVKDITGIKKHVIERYMSFSASDLDVKNSKLLHNEIPTIEKKRFPEYRWSLSLKHDKHEYDLDKSDDQSDNKSQSKSLIKEYVMDHEIHDLQKNKHWENEFLAKTKKKKIEKLAISFGSKSKDDYGLEYQIQFAGLSNLFSKNDLLGSPTFINPIQKPTELKDSNVFTINVIKPEKDHNISEDNLEIAQKGSKKRSEVKRSLAIIGGMSDQDALYNFANDQQIDEKIFSKGLNDNIVSKKDKDDFLLENSLDFLEYDSGVEDEALKRGQNFVYEKDIDKDLISYNIESLIDSKLNAKYAYTRNEWKSLIEQSKRYNVSKKTLKQRLNIGYILARTHLFTFEIFILVFKCVITIYMLVLVGHIEVVTSSLLDRTVSPNIYENYQDPSKFDEDFMERLIYDLLQILFDVRFFRRMCTGLLVCIVINMFSYVGKTFYFLAAPFSLITNFLLIFKKHIHYYFFIISFGLFITILFYCIAGSDIEVLSMFPGNFIYELRLLCQDAEVLKYFSKNEVLQACLDIFVNAMVVYIVLHGALRITIVNYIKKKHYNKQIKEKIFSQVGELAFFDYETSSYTLYIIITMFMKSIKKIFGFIFCRKKMIKEAQFERINEQLDKDRKKCPKNWKFNINITDSQFKQYQENEKSRNSKTDKIQIAKISIWIGSIMIIIITVLMASLTPLSSPHVSTFVNDKIASSFSQCKSKFHNEYEIRRYLIDCLPYLIQSYGTESSPYKNVTLQHQDLSFNNRFVNIISMYKFTATYRNITDNDDPIFNVYSPHIFGEFDENYYPEDLFRDDDYTFLQWDAVNNTHLTVIEKNDVYYYWNNETKKHVAFIKIDKGNNFPQVLSKLVLDEFINKYLYDLELSFVSFNSKENYANNIFLHFKKGSGDSFYISQYSYGWGQNKQYNTIQAKCFMALLFVYLFFQLLKYIIQMYKLYLIYKCWYKIEISGRFSDFMLRERNKFGPEWQRFICLMSKMSLIKCIVQIVQIINTFIGLNKIDYYSDIATQQILRMLEQKDDIDISKLPNKERESLFKENEYLTQQMIDHAPFDLYKLFLGLFQMNIGFIASNMWSLKQLKRYETIVGSTFYSFFYVMLVVMPTTIFFAGFIQLCGHVSNGENDMAFLHIENWMSILSQILCPAPLMTTNIHTWVSDDVWLYLFMYAFCIIPIRYFFLFSVMAKLQIHVDKSDNENNYYNDEKYENKVNPKNKKQSSTGTQIQQHLFGKTIMNYMINKDKDRAFKSFDRIFQYFWRANNSYPDTSKITTLVSYLEKTDNNHCSSLSPELVDCQIIKIFVQFESLIQYREVISSIFLKELFFNEVTQKLMNKRNHRSITTRRNENLGKVKYQMYHKIINDLVDCGRDVNNCLSQEFAKSDALTNRANEKHIWDKKIKKRIAYIKELEMRLFFMTNVLSFESTLCKNDLYAIRRKKFVF